MRSLLDISVVIALLDPDHDFHARAHTWWHAHRDQGWASCPLTENGVVRIMANPSYNRRRSLAPQAVIDLLGRFVHAGNHEFWADELSILDGVSIDSARIMGPRQITDLYLLALAVKHQGRLVTFDESIYVGAVTGAREQHLAIV
ncbi:MAG: TA system VapC family ribonuclease toxin [Spirochaetales bacterium]